MKLIRTEKNLLAFSLSRREKALLFKVLQMYPLVPPAHHRLSKSGKQVRATEHQQLLDEAVAEQRNENRNRVRLLLEDQSRFPETQNEVRFSIKREEIEWLLKVLNDVRIGAWLALGEPEERFLPVLNETNTPYIFAMEVSGHFQVEILAALGRHEPTQS